SLIVVTFFDFPSATPFSFSSSFSSPSLSSLIAGFSSISFIFSFPLLFAFPSPLSEDREEFDRREGFPALPPSTSLLLLISFSFPSLLC
ncbi:hypothetical protein PFISCL1PPCAC_2500, partial [Pristionchus fissidentatus]